MRVLVLGGDGYLGWPTAMMLAARGDDVVAVDNYLRRTIARQTCSEALIARPNLEDRARAFGPRRAHSVGSTTRFPVAGSSFSTQVRPSGSVKRVQRSVLERASLMRNLR